VPYWLRNGALTSHRAPASYMSLSRRLIVRLRAPASFNFAYSFHWLPSLASALVSCWFAHRRQPRFQPQVVCSRQPSFHSHRCVYSERLRTRCPPFGRASLHLDRAASWRALVTAPVTRARVNARRPLLAGFSSRVHGGHPVQVVRNRLCRLKLCVHRLIL
jgi:hypothetical protein